MGRADERRRNGLPRSLASTLDSHLNWGASYWSNDIYRRLICRAWLGREPSGRALVWVARLSNLFILGLSLVVLTRLTSIQSAWKMSLLLGAGMGGPLLLRWLWWRANAAAELLAIVVSRRSSTAASSNSATIQGPRHGNQVGGGLAISHEPMPTNRQNTASETPAVARKPRRRLSTPLRAEISPPRTPAAPQATAVTPSG
jgi:hypothetical protein